MTLRRCYSNTHLCLCLWSVRITVQCVWNHYSICSILIDLCVTRVEQLKHSCFKSCHKSVRFVKDLVTQILLRCVSTNTMLCPADYDYVLLAYFILSKVICQIHFSLDISLFASLIYKIRPKDTLNSGTLWNEDRSLEGQIKPLGRPILAPGPQFGHPWTRGRCKKHNSLHFISIWKLETNVSVKVWITE